MPCITGLDITVDPKENEVKNFREEVIIERKLTAKHYWLPFKNEDVMINSAFKQNQVGNLLIVKK